MSAIADMSSSSFGIASGTRGASLDVTGPSDLLGGRHGSCLWCVIMSGAARHRDRWLPLLLAAFFVITLGSGAAWPAMGGGHGGGHGGGFGGGHPVGSFRGGREFGAAPSVGGRSPPGPGARGGLASRTSTIPNTGNTRTPRTAIRMPPPTPLS